MNRINGWEVYLKIKELSKNEVGTKIHIGDVIRELGISKELANEYLRALAILEFIRFTDGTKETFVITDLGIG